MQKIMICIARPEKIERSQWNNQVEELVTANAERFTACGYAVIDEHVAPAHLLQLIYANHPHDAVISLWTENAYQLDDLFTEVAALGEYQAYSVLESTAISHHFKVGRVAGMCQIAFITKPAAQSRQAWLEAWLGDHTRIAIDTQSNFAYRQNVISVPLPLKVAQAPQWPLMDAIVEENFPAIAMTSREAFFDAEGDPEKFERHQQIMMQSCMLFIDFEAFDCVPMSQYIIKTL